MKGGEELERIEGEKRPVALLDVDHTLVYSKQGVGTEAGEVVLNVALLDLPIWYLMRSLSRIENNSLKNWSSMVSECMG